MRRLLLLGGLTAMLIVGQLLTNCSKPLDSTVDPDPQPIIDTVFLIDTIIESDTVISVDTIYGVDTVIVIDTLIHNDTTYVIDTLFQYDTLIVIDTLIQSDTIIVTDTVIQTDTVVQTDTLIEVDTVIVDIVDTVIVPTGYCARLASSQKEIIWMLQNTEGSYLLEFVATVERAAPPQLLIVEIDGQLVEWQVTNTQALSIEQDLGENVTARIWPGKPPSFGHAVDICLSVIEK